MSFDRPTLRQITDRIIGDFESRITGGSSLLRRSFVKVAARVYAGAIHLVYGFIEYLKLQLFATTADSEYLDYQGSEIGVVRNPAAKATGIGEATGTNGKVIPALTQLQSGSGQVYLTNSAETIAGGVATLNFTTQTAGVAGNDDGSIELIFVTPIAGVDTIVTVDSNGITGGSDTEIDDDFRERILNKKRTPPQGGSEFDYVRWAKEVSGVTRVWTHPKYQGDGTIGITFVRDDDVNIIPNAAQRDAVRSYLVSHTDPSTGLDIGIPVTAEPGLFMITLTSQTVNLSISIYPDTTAVRATITAKVEKFIATDGGPGETLYFSNLSEAISAAVGEERHKITSPVVDITSTATQVPELGTITWSSY